MDNLHRHVIASGVTLRLPDEVELDLSRPYTACRICGTIFQSVVDRYSGPYPVRFPVFISSEEERVFTAMQMRKLWSQTHAKKHSDSEHLKLAYSGMWATPEAAKVLASYGIIALSDMVLFDESEDALRLSSPMPEKEVESVLRGYF